MFWDIMGSHDPTWYYASPSMHSTILAEVSERQDARSKCRLRLVYNAAGGLLPSLASQLRDTFEWTVLASYGMTECMPISAPPMNYNLERPGTSGLGIGPEVAVLGGVDNHLPNHTKGRIAIRGSPLFPGYLKSGHLDKSCFSKRLRAAGLTQETWGILMMTAIYTSPEEAKKW